MLQGTTGLLIKVMTLKKHLLAWKAFWMMQTSDAKSNLYIKITPTEARVPDLGHSVNPLQADT